MLPQTRSCRSRIVSLANSQPAKIQITHYVSHTFCAEDTLLGTLHFYLSREEIYEKIDTIGANKKGSARGYRYCRAGEGLNVRSQAERLFPRLKPMTTWSDCRQPYSCTVAALHTPSEQR